MTRIPTCIALEHDLRLVALSALICILGCFTTTSLLRRVDASAPSRVYFWLFFAAINFGCSVWSLHFVAMLAFMPGMTVFYDTNLTALSALVASFGVAVALLVRQAPLARWLRLLGSGLLVGASVTGMHYLGVAAMGAPADLTFDPTYVAASVVTCLTFSVVALVRADTLDSPGRCAEVAVWLSLAICGVHFIGMAAIGVAPRMTSEMMPGAHTGVLGSTTFGIAVGGIVMVILIASLIASMVEHHMSQRIQKELQRMRLLSNVAQEILFIHRDNVVLEINRAGERLFKQAARDIIGRPVSSLFTSDSEPILTRRQQCPPGDRKPEEIDAQVVGGSRVSVELSCEPIEYLGRPATVVVLRDLTDRNRNEARIQHLARHDALTDLPNRHTLLERLDHELNTTARQKGTLAIVYLDIDRFKPVNDRYGHAVGDALLVQVSGRILREIQPFDTLARIGGDEFVLMLLGDAQPEKISIVVNRIIEALRRPFLIEGNRIEISASAGVALYPNDGAAADTLLRAADAAMYRVKQSGRGAFRFYEASMNAQLQARLQLETELAGAVERQELMLYYQPIVRTVTREVETFEALIRWNHPRRGLIPPGEFISLAEEVGLINQIGHWVIETACREAATWNHPWRVAVNVSPRQFHQSDLCGSIVEALRKSAIDPARLVVEVTEGVLIDDAPNAVATLNRLRQIGVQVALDDFGTGYSSLSYLQIFKFDKFKIDKSFVNELEHSEDARTIIRAIVNLGHNLGLDVTVEGVETFAQLAIVQALGCDRIQGYLIAEPALMESFLELDFQRVRALFSQDQQRLSA
jgi:diguanylate cyclase (GGDEF)-like protein/PAS domain S-box-containing protein